MNVIKFLIGFTLLCLFSLHAKSQDLSRGPECLGDWCTIDVHLDSDPTDGRYASYPFPHTPEYLGPMQYNNGYPMYYDNTYFYGVGPGRPYITVEGGDPILHLDLKNLKIETTVMAQEQGYPDYVITTVDFPVQRTIEVLGSISQCHYHIRLIVWMNN